jgi:hypothetical protein
MPPTRSLSRSQSHDFRCSAVLAIIEVLRFFGFGDAGLMD